MEIPRPAATRLHRKLKNRMYRFAEKHSLTGFEAAGVMFALATEVMASALVREGLLQGGPDWAEEDVEVAQKAVGDAAVTEAESDAEAFQLQPASIKPGAIHSLVCRYLRNRSIGYTFSFAAIADYIESFEGIDLDRTLVKSERRERWRNQVSMSINKLRRYGCLHKGDKNSHYILVEHP
jgi:hypothetical protein